MNTVQEIKESNSHHIKEYNIQERFHVGPYTELYYGNRIKDGKKVILKFALEKRFIKKGEAALQHEYQLLKKLRNQPGIIQADSLFKHNNTWVLVLDDGHGRSLHEFINGSPLKLEQFFIIGLQLVDIINRLHQFKIIHKDIKPQNILIDSNTLEVTLIDLSFASEFITEIQENITPNILEGTLAYMAPEQTGRINHTIDNRSDIYALGVTFFEMLTGQLPFNAEDPLELIYCHIAKMPPEVSKINPKIPLIISQMIARMLAKSPKDRYNSIEGLKHDLVECAKRWRENKAIPNFTLGQHDFNESLLIYNKLYGRDRETNILLETIKRISEDNAEVLLLTGPSGVGKTQLIKEIKKHLSFKNVILIKGKFDQLNRSKPYSAIIEAFTELVRQTLTTSEEQIKTIQKKLKTALGNNGSVITEVIPELELIIGKQPNVPILGPIEAQNRFNLQFQNFINVFESQLHPIILFLDDIQWADIASLKLLESLFINAKIKHFLLLASYRDNEITTGSPLYTTIEKFHTENIPIRKLDIRPLQQSDITNLLSDTFNCNINKASVLAKTIMEQTQGVPFYIYELLRNWHTDKLINYSHDTHEWEWDINKIKQETITDNVIDLLLLKVQRLPQEAQELLEIAACIGYNFDLALLMQITGKSDEIIIPQLQQAVQSNLIIPFTDNYSNILFKEEDSAEQATETNINSSREAIVFKFRHDRVQQAIYERLTKENKKGIHVKIGLLLQKLYYPIEQNNEKLFEITNHLNYLDKEHLDTEELWELIKLNLLAGLKAKSATAFQLAAHYLQIGINLLPDEAWMSHYLETYTLYKEYAESQYFNGNTDEANKSAEITLANAKSNIDIVDIYHVKIRYYFNLGKYDIAGNLGFSALKILNFQLDQNSKPYHILFNTMKIKLFLGNKSPSDIDVNKATDLSLEKKYIIKTLAILIPIIYVWKPVVFALMVCKGTYLSLKHGSSEYSGLIYILFAVLLIRFNQFKYALEFVALAKKLEQQYTNSAILGHAYIFLGSLVGFWQSHARTVYEYAKYSEQLNFESGNLKFTGIAKVTIQIANAFLGIPIRDYIKHSQECISFLKQYKNEEHLEFSVFCCQANQYLQNNNTIQLNDLTKHLDTIKNQHQDRIALKSAYSIQCRLYYLAEEYENAIAIAEEAIPYTKKALIHLLDIERNLFHALAITANFDKYITRQEKQQAWQTLKRIKNLFNTWKNQSPSNFLCRYALICAEMARLKKRDAEAITLYEQAIELAERGEFLHLIAIANECLGRFYITQNKNKLAKFYIQEAYYGYKTWGAYSKASILEQRYSPWITPSENIDHKLLTNTASKPYSISLESINSFDFISVLKSIQALSNEINLEKLLQRLLIILQENAGAQRSVLISKQGEQWVIKAEGTSEKQDIDIYNSTNIASHADIPLTLINYVIRTKEALIFQDAANSERALLDPYINLAKPRSVLIMPISHHEQLQHIIYLENNSASDIFTDRLFQILKILSSQLSISIDNANLYHQATHDPLTGLSNRNLLYQVFNHSVKIANRNNNIIALLFFDIDLFKKINDTLGHDVGDKVLLHVANILKAQLREGVLATRLGGDEFVVMLENLADIAQAKAIVERIYKALDEPITVNNYNINISISMGISIYPLDGSDIQTLLKNADAALYYVKSKGKGFYQFYQNHIKEYLRNQLFKEIELQTALDNNELLLHYQPIYDSDTGKITSLEALLRWQHPSRGLLLAEDFIATLEENGFIDPIGEWIIHTACRQAKAWENQGITGIPIAINISPYQLKKQNLSKIFEKVLKDEGLNPNQIILEFTESVLIDNTSKVADEINELKNLGLKLVIDDFGTGYSTLAYLKRFPVHKIKIDKQFIQNISNDHLNRAIIETVGILAQKLDVITVAEGVETDEQLEFLRSCNIKEIQGFYFSKPQDVQSMTKLLVKQFQS